MGCGCGKKATRPANVATTTVARTQDMNRVDSARTFQSATLQKAPTGPVGTGRKTV